MYILYPTGVTFGSASWPNVQSITIDRAAQRRVIGHGDSGPYPTFADVPEQVIELTIVQELQAGDGFDAPLPGQGGDLSFKAAKGAADARARSVVVPIVVLAVKHVISTTRAQRTIIGVAVSSNGVNDPVSVSDA